MLNVLYMLVDFSKDTNAALNEYFLICRIIFVENCKEMKYKNVSYV